MVCILNCGCFNLSCNIWVCVCVGFVMCVCVCVCVCVGFVMCVCVCGFCNVWVCVCVCVCEGGLVMCGCFENCVGDLVICVLVFTVFCIFLFMYIYSHLLLVQGPLPANGNSI